MKDPLKHPDKFGAGAKARKDVPCNLKFGVVMKEFERGTLYSGSGQKVPEDRPDIAKAIAYSETRKCEAKKR